MDESTETRGSLTMAARIYGLLLALLLMANIAVAQPARPPGLTVTVSTTPMLKQALSRVQPGSVILLQPGVYAGGFSFSELQGRSGAWVTIRAADPLNKPVIRGGGDCLKLSGVAFLELSDLVFEAPTDNALIIDDGGPEAGMVAHDILLRGLEVRNLPATGVHDAIQLAGVDRFRVEGCVVDKWGGGGYAISMVGCHDGLIESSDFRHAPGNTAAGGVEARGMSRNIVVRFCRFEYAGVRAVQFGGTTPTKWFRPALPEKGAYEAKGCVVERCTIVGSQTAVAFVGIDGSIARFNTMFCPTEWVVRVLQGSHGPQFVSCRNGEFSNNLVVFRSGQLIATAGIGEKTESTTFKFADNFWYCADDPPYSVPRLPAMETGGTFGRNPMLVDPQHGDFNVRPGSPAAHAGAHAVE